MEFAEHFIDLDACPTAADEATELGIALVLAGARDDDQAGLLRLIADAPAQQAALSAVACAQFAGVCLRALP